jgi:8-oxo-dGTP pyrophosphatase MutT (NUDIX family)
MLLAMDKAPGGIAAGILFVASDGDVLLLRRSSTEENFAGHWSLPGGKADDGETADQAARREAVEEIGDHPDGKRELLDERTTPTGMTFHTFRQRVASKFVPKLNAEHSGYAWASRDLLPEPLHPAVKEILASAMAADAARRRGAIAFDKKSVRRTDSDGRLHIEAAHISKANVCEYLGREIPEFKELGLDPDKLYRLYRDPEELAKGATTFNNIPILSRHVPVDARDHQPDLVIGSTGTDAAFPGGGYLDNSLVFWAGDAIDDIESDRKKELSSAYRYRADMTPGTSPDGEAYDGVMRDIIGNHVALVKEGRAGSDVVVGDSAIAKLEEVFDMSKILLTRKGSVALGAVMIALKPKLALDAKLDLGPIFAKLTDKNFKARKAGIVAGLKTATTGKLAQDATLDDVIKVVDALEGTEVTEGADTDIETGETIEPEESMDAEGGALQNFLKGKLGEDDFKKACDMMKPSGARDAEESEEDKKKREAEEAKKIAGDVETAVAEKTKDMVTTKAMDEKIKTAVEGERARATATVEAREAVRPYVGAVSMALDSAAGVYKAALTILGVEDLDKIDASAYPALLKAQTAPSTTAKKPAPAMDAAATKSFADRYPHASKIRVSA